MTVYTAYSPKSKNYQLYKDDLLRGEINYVKWYSSDATAHVKGRTYQLTPTSGFKPKLLLTHDNTIMAESILTWKGIHITTKWDDKEHTYMLKRKGVFSGTYALTDENNEELLLIESKIEWKTFRTRYTITVNYNMDRYAQLELLILFLVHSIQYQMASNQRVTVVT
jgi:hypothetical protein